MRSPLLDSLRAVSPRRPIIALVVASLAVAASVVVPSQAMAAGPSISGTLHFPTGLDATKNFGSIDLYDSTTFESFEADFGSYDPATGDASFEASGLQSGSSYFVNYDGPNLDDDPAVRAGFTSVQWSDGGTQAVPVPASTLDLAFDIHATAYVSGVLQFATGLDPSKEFGRYQYAGGSEDVRHDWIDWFGSYDPSTGQVPFIARDFSEFGSVNLTYAGVSGDPATLPSPAGYQPVVWNGVAGGSTEWNSVVGIPVGTEDVVLDMRDGAGYTGSVELPTGFDPWAGDSNGGLYEVADISLYEEDSNYATILSYDQSTNTATYVINGIAPGSYHPLVKPYDTYGTAAKNFVPQLSGGEITIAAATSAATSIATTAGILVAADFTIPRPAVISGTLTQAGAPKGGYTDGSASLVVDGEPALGSLFLQSSKGKPGSEKYTIAVPTGVHALGLDVDVITNSKSGVPAFSSHSVVSVGSANRTAGTTYKIASKAVARTAMIAGTVYWDWPWGDDPSPADYYESDEAGTIELLKKNGTTWDVVDSTHTMAVYGGRFAFPSIAAGTYKIRIDSDDPTYCATTYFGGATEGTAKQIVIGKTTSVTNVLLEPTVECGALISNRTAITGSQRVGATLTASKGRWSTGTKLTYAWFRGATKVSTKTTYKLTTKDAGAIVSLTVTGSKAGYPTKVVELHTAKIITAATPAISGTAKVGKVLTAKAGTWTVGTTLTYQWYRGSTAIPGATETTYTLISSDKKKKVSVRVTGTLADYATITTASAAKTIG